MRAAPRDWRRPACRTAARFLIGHGFPGCSVLLRNGYKLLGPAPEGPFTVETLYGFPMQLDPRRHRGVDASIYFNGTYEAGSIDVIRRTLRAGDTFVDAGANIGLMTLAAAQVVGPSGAVHAFEPVPDVHRILAANVARAGARNVTAHPVALGAVNEERTIWEQPDINKGSASLVPPAAPGAGAGHAVRVATLDQVLADQRVGAVRMLKADVEGWELELLRGARGLLGRADAPALCIEYSQSYSPRSEELMDLYDFILSVNRYAVFKLRFGKETVSPLVPVRSARDLPRHDNIFCFLPHHRHDGAPA